MTTARSERARRRARRKRRRLVRRISVGSSLSLFLLAFLFATNSIHVSPQATAMRPPPAQPESPPDVKPTQPELPVLVFHPSIFPDALEAEVPDVGLPELELPEIDGSIAEMQPAENQEQPALPSQSMPRQMRADVIHLSALELDLLVSEIIEPKPCLDPQQPPEIPELLESPKAVDQQARVISALLLSRSIHLLR
jgi:hypothetical protein